MGKVKVSVRLIKHHAIKMNGGEWWYRAVLYRVVVQGSTLQTGGTGQYFTEYFFNICSRILLTDTQKRFATPQSTENINSVHFPLFWFNYMHV